MTVPSSVAKSGPYDSNGVTDVFNYDFRIVDEAHLTVILTSTADEESTLTLATHYTVSGVGDQSGSINLTSAGLALAVSGTKITILRNPPFTQETDLQNQGPYLAQTVEDRFDLITMQVQTIKERSDRSIAIPASDEGTTLDDLTEDLIRIADSADNIDTVAGIETEVGTVAGISTEVTTVAGISTEVQTVAARDADIGTVAARDLDIGTVADRDVDIGTVAGVADDVATVASIASDVTTVAGISADVSTVADNVADVTNFSDVYLGGRATAPTTRTDGSALVAGDQYFDTADDKLKVWTGSAWVGGTGDLISTNNGSDFEDPVATLGNLGGQRNLENVSNFELGKTAPPASAFIDFHTNTGPLDYSARIIVRNTALDSTLEILNNTPGADFNLATTGAGKVTVNGLDVLSTASHLALLAGATQTRSQLDRTQEKRYSLFEWIPAALIAGILAGTNTTPLTTYVQAALNSGKPIEVPIGTFLIDAQIGPPAAADMVGSHKYRSIFKVADGANINPFYATNKENIALRNFTLDCNKANQTAGNGIILVGCKHHALTGLVIKDPFNDGISIGDDCWYFDINDCEVWNAGNHGISLSGDNTDGESSFNCRHGSVSRNRVYNPTASGINGSECRKVTFVDNHVEHAGSHTAGNGGVRLTNGARDCPAVANTVIGMSRGIFLIEAYRCPVVANTIDNAGLQGIFVAQDTVATFLKTVECPVIGNTIRNPGRSALSDAIRLDGGTRCPVMGNVMQCSDTQMEYGIRSTGGERNIITANISTGATVADFYADNTSDKVYGNNGDRSDDAIAAAATITLPSDGDFFNVTGTTAITTINGGWQGRRVTLRLQNGLTLNHGTGNLSLNGDVNKTIVAGETINLAFLPNTWFQA